MAPTDESTPAVKAGEAADPAAPVDLPARAAARVEAVVNVLRDKSVRPVLAIVQALIFGLIVIAMLLVLAVLFSAAVLRLLDVFVFSHRVWASYTLLGGIFSLTGLFLLSRRNRSRGSEA